MMRLLKRLDIEVLSSILYIKALPSRDHRPDLKQFIIDLICSGDGDVPLFFKVADENQTDSAVLG